MIPKWLTVISVIISVIGQSIDAYSWPPRDKCAATDSKYIDLSTYKALIVNYQDFENTSQIHSACDLENIFIYYYGQVRRLVGRNDPESMCEYLRCMSVYNNTYVEFFKNEGLFR